VLCAINANNPDRIDILFPPRLIGQLRIMAVLSQFHIYNN
jgi:phage tail sheath gpL-like